MHFLWTPAGLPSISLVLKHYDKQGAERRDDGKEQAEKRDDEGKRKILKIYSRWISNLKPCSIPDSGIKVCSARHDKNFPWSSSVGWYVKIDLVKFPSCDVCAWRKWRQGWSKIIISFAHDAFSCSPIHESFAAVSILSTMKSAEPVVIPSPRTSSRTNDSPINTLHLDLILSLMDALIWLEWEGKRRRIAVNISSIRSHRWVTSPSIKAPIKKSRWKTINRNVAKRPREIVKSFNGK